MATRALCYANFHGCFFAQAGNLEQASRHLGLGNDQATVFHVDSEEGIYANSADDDSAKLLCQRFLNQLGAFINKGGRCVWSAGSITPRGQLSSTLAKELRTALAGLAHAIHCSSFALAEELHTTFDVDWRKLVVVPNGSYRPLQEHPPSSSKQAIREGLGIDAGQTVFVHLGRPHQMSGTKLLLEAWAKADPKGTTLILTEPMANLAGYRADHPDGDSIRVAPSGNTIVELMNLAATADFVVLPFLDDLGPAEVMLGLSSGRPVLVPAFSSLLEIVAHQREALMFEPYSEATFEACLDLALGLDPNSLLSMASRAQRRAETMSWRMLGRQLSDTFLRVTAGHVSVLPELTPWANAEAPKQPQRIEV